MAELDEHDMAAVAREVLGLPHDHVYSYKREDEKFRSFFGAPIKVIAKVWNMIQPLDDTYAAPKHLLWALVFLKVYSTTEVHCRIVGWPDPKTYRKWCWYMLEQVAELKDRVIRLENRFIDWDGKASCLISIDGTDCPVNEPWPFDTQMYSKKFNGPAVKYEVGVCIQTGSIVWICGAFVASTNDATIFKDTLANLLADDEGVEVDAGYKGHDKMKAPNVATSSVARKQKSVVRGRHENVNGRLKIYNVLNIPFRHLKPRNVKLMLKKHSLCFFAIAVVTQLKFEAGEKLYDVVYDQVNYD